MKTLFWIILTLLLSVSVFGQGEVVVTLRGSGTGGAPGIDTIPSQFTFTDVTGAALNSYNTAFIVVAGCDSARFYPAANDTIREGVLGTKTVSPIWVNLGDTVYTFNSASGTNFASTHSIVYSSDGTPVDTFSVRTVAASGTYTAGVDYVWDHTTITNNTDFYEWFDSTANNLRIYGTDSDPYRPRNVDSGVVWQSYDNFFRQVASFPAGLFDGALTIEMVVKVIRTDSSQCFFQARNTSNIAMGIGIGSTGIFVGNAYDATNAEDYTHNSAATTGWYVLHYVWDGTTTTAFYVNGVVATDVGDVEQYGMISGDNRLSMGKTSSTNFPICTGTLIPYVAVFKEALNATQVENNFNSAVIKDHIPVWAQ